MNGIFQDRSLRHRQCSENNHLGSVDFRVISVKYSFPKALVEQLFTPAKLKAHHSARNTIFFVLLALLLSGYRLLLSKNHTIFQQSIRKNDTVFTITYRTTCNRSVITSPPEVFIRTRYDPLARRDVSKRSECAPAS